MPHQRTAAFKAGYYNSRWNHRLAVLGYGPPYIYAHGEDTYDWSDRENDDYQAGWDLAVQETGYAYR